MNPEKHYSIAEIETFYESSRPIEICTLDLQTISYDLMR